MQHRQKHIVYDTERALRQTLEDQERSMSDLAEENRLLRQRLQAYEERMATVEAGGRSVFRAAT